MEEHAEVADLIALKWRYIENTDAVYRLLDHYIKLYNKKPCASRSCADAIKSFHHSLRLKKIRYDLFSFKKKDKPVTAYRLHPGKKIFIHSLSMHLSEENLTDELAAKAIEENPRLASAFAHIPLPKENPNGKKVKI